jgi:hypothetical protein
LEPLEEKRVMHRPMKVVERQVVPNTAQERRGNCRGHTVRAVEGQPRAGLARERQVQRNAQGRVDDDAVQDDERQLRFDLLAPLKLFGLVLPRGGFVAPASVVGPVEQRATNEEPTEIKDDDGEDSEQHRFTA